MKPVYIFFYDEITATTKYIFDMINYKMIKHDAPISDCVDLLEVEEEFNNR
jgi:hypothetical protein